MVALVSSLLLAGTSEAAQLTRTPYLQLVTPNSALVAFRTDASCKPAVHYGLGGDTSQVAQASATGTLHAVQLSGLQPGAEYSYSVEACGATSATTRFVTAPAPGTQRAHFSVVGDFGTGGTAERDVSNAILRARPEFVVGVGDGAYENGTEQEHQDHLFTPMAALLQAVPLFPTTGNHEYNTNQAQPYLDNFYLPTNNPAGTERYYSFDWGPLHMVALDSNCAIGLATKASCDNTAQKAWLEADLAATKQPWKVVYFHHPPWSSGDHGSILQARTSFGPIMERHGVDLVLTGHDHYYERSYPMKGDVRADDGIPYIVAGNGGNPHMAFASAKPSWSAARVQQQPGFLDVSVEGGQLSARMLSPSGAVLDSFQLTKTVTPPPATTPPATTPPTETPSTPPVAETPSTPDTPVASTPPGTSPSTPDTTPAPGGLDNTPSVTGSADPTTHAGCSATGAQALLLLAVPVALGLLRRRRSRQ